MNDRRLEIYLTDHLALMVGEVELAGRCWRSNQQTPLGKFLRQLENEIKAQQSIARHVLLRIGGTEGLEGRAKQSAAWIAEKLGRFKLNDSLLSYSPLSRVVELETLAAASLERIALWDNLDAVAGRDSRLHGINFVWFREQTQRHLEELNTRRRFAAAEAFVTGDE